MDKSLLVVLRITLNNKGLKLCGKKKLYLYYLFSGKQSDIFDYSVEEISRQIGLDVVEEFDISGYYNLPSIPIVPIKEGEPVKVIRIDSIEFNPQVRFVSEITESSILLTDPEYLADHNHPFEINSGIFFRGVADMGVYSIYYLQKPKKYEVELAERKRQLYLDTKHLEEFFSRSDWKSRISEEEIRQISKIVKRKN